MVLEHEFSPKEWARMGWRERFWRRVVRYAERQAHRHYMRRAYHDRRCSNCGTWGALGPGFDWEGLVMQPDRPWLERLRCRKCGVSSLWDCSGMAPVPATPDHEPRLEP